MQTIEERADALVARFRAELEAERVSRETELANDLEWQCQKRLTLEEFKLFKRWLEKNRGLLKAGGK